jgi:hypothetical protein
MAPIRRMASKPKRTAINGPRPTLPVAHQHFCFVSRVLEKKMPDSENKGRELAAPTVRRHVGLGDVNTRFNTALFQRAFAPYKLHY